MLTTAPAQNPPAMLIGSKLELHARKPGWIPCVSPFSAVIGWSLVWAAGLEIVPEVLCWIGIALFLLGIVLIPSGFPLEAEAKHRRRRMAGLIALNLAGLMAAGTASAQNCPVSHDQLTKALKEAVKPAGGPTNGGFDNNEWAAAVNRDGTICAITFSGDKPGDQWLGSRAIAAEKANTANGLSLAGMALSTANLYAATAPGGPLLGLVATNPADPSLVSAGDPTSFGSARDPYLGKHLGGVVVFGGGLALYANDGIVGGLGVSGDTSCADHNVAWRVRHALGFDHVPNGVSPAHNDAIIYDMLPDKTSVSGYGHPQCGGGEAAVASQIGSGFLPKWAKVMKK